MLENGEEPFSFDSNSHTFTFWNEENLELSGNDSKNYIITVFGKVGNVQN